jgi:hypothetical protein
MKRRDLEKAVEQSGMAVNGITVLKAYASHATYKDDNCIVWPGVRKIAEITGMNKDTVSGWRKDLIEYGWMTVVGQHVQDTIVSDKLELNIGTLGGKLVKKSNRNGVRNLDTYNARRKAKAAFIAKAKANAKAAWELSESRSEGCPDLVVEGVPILSGKVSEPLAEAVPTVRTKEPSNNHLEQPIEITYGGDSDDSQGILIPGEAGHALRAAPIIPDSSAGNISSDVVIPTDNPTGPIGIEDAKRPVYAGAMEKAKATLVKHEHNPKTCRRNICRECADLSDVGKDW